MRYLQPKRNLSNLISCECDGAMDRDQRFPKVLLWAEISGSQVIRSYWVLLWCFPSADWNQSARRLYIIGGLYLPCSVGCVSSGSQHKIWIECFIHTFCFPRALCLPLHLCFLGPVLLSVDHFDRISGWLRVLLQLPRFRHQGTALLWPFLWLCAVFW